MEFSYAGCTAVLVTSLVGAAIAAAALVIAALVASLRTPGDRARSSMQHLAAGIVCGVVAAELTPEALETARPLEVVAGFVAGLGLMLGAKAAAERLAGPGGQSGLLLAAGVDVSIDGLLIGVAFAIGSSTGSLLVLAFSVELAALGLAIGATARSWRRSLSRATILALPVVPGAALGFLVLARMPASFEAALVGFAMSVLLYLVVEELIREAHQVKEYRLATLAFFGGFLGLLVLEMKIVQ